MIALLEQAAQSLEHGQPVVLATIIDRHGSAPRTAGAKMLIWADGRIFGTIGGGLLEAQVMRQAWALLTGDQVQALLSFDLTNEDVAGSDMICGGGIQVFLDRLEPDEPTRLALTAWREALLHQARAFFVTVIPEPSDKPLETLHLLLDHNGRPSGESPLPLDVLDQILELGNSSPYLGVLSRPETTILVEPTRKPKTAYILGAGHVSKPTAHLAALVGFRVVVLDDRPEFADPARFPDADQVTVLPDFNQALAGLPVDEDSFVVIVTRGHLHDRTALAQMLRTPAGYIGMIGSRRKRNAIYNALLEEGFTPDDLGRVHSPIGLKIGAETPEEIAVSIVAELIKFRTGANA